MAKAIQIVALLSIFYVSVALGISVFHFQGTTKDGASWNPPLYEHRKCSVPPEKDLYKFGDYYSRRDEDVVINCTVEEGFQNHFKLYLYKDLFDASSPCLNLVDILVDHHLPSKRNLILKYSLPKGYHTLVVTSDNGSVGEYSITLSTGGYVTSSNKQYYPITSLGPCSSSSTASPYGYYVWTHPAASGQYDFQAAFITDDPWSTYLVIYNGDITNWPSGTLNPCSPPDSATILTADNCDTNAVTISSVDLIYHQDYTAVFSGIGSTAYAEYSLDYGPSPTSICPPNKQKKPIASMP